MKFRYYASALEQNRFMQRTKKKKKRDTLRISVAVIQRFNVKKKSLSLKFGCNLCISVKIVISEQITLAAIFYRVGMLSTNN